MIVDGVGKVVGRDAVRFEEDKVLVVFRHFDGALDEIVKAEAAAFVAVRAQTHDIRLSRPHAPQRLLGRQVTAHGVPAVIPGAQLLLLLLRVGGLQCLGRTEAGVSQTLLHHPLDIGLIDFAAQALLVGGIGPAHGARRNKALVDGESAAQHAG